MSVCPAKIQTSLGIRHVWSEFSLSAWRNIGTSATRWAHSEDSEQSGCTLILLVLSCRGSYNKEICDKYWHLPRFFFFFFFFALSDATDTIGTYNERNWLAILTFFLQSIVHN